jgi:ribosomal protein S18 acetylase RimI-like enzyme
MPIRPFKLPDDARILTDIIPLAFQYPENDTWSVQADEMEGMIDSMRGLRRMWPVLRLIGLVSPGMRDAMRGFIWEEDGQPVGVSNVLRRGLSDGWMIGNVAVLPAYRRRGIARKLVEACMDLARERGAKQIVLDVVAGNTPAYRLYEALGFVHFGGSVEYAYNWSGPLPEAASLPDSCRIEPLDLFDWRTRYTLDRQITPQDLQTFEPVEEARYQLPRLLRPFFPLFMKISGSRSHMFMVCDSGGAVVGVGGYSRRTRSGGTNGMHLRLDPAHGALARPVMACFLHDLQQSGADRCRRCTRL